MGRRTILLIAALLVAAVATSLVFFYVRGVNNRALRDQQPVQVLVATGRIAQGTSASDALSKGQIDRRTLPRTAVVPGALTSLSNILNAVALSDIFPGEQILATKFGAAGAVTGLPIPPGKIAISVPLGDPQRVAGFVQPGSEVVIFVSMTGGQGSAAQPAGATSAPSAAPTGGAFTAVLLQRVTVIAVGSTTARPDGTAGAQRNRESLPTALLTLAVDHAQAAKVIFASQNGELYFGLLTKDSSGTPFKQRIDPTNLFATAGAGQ